MKVSDITKRVLLNPQEPNFYNNPYPYYEVLREQVPIFYWEEFDLWCFITHEDVSKLLRDKRFGRQILHLTTREKLGWPPIRPEVKPFYDKEQYSLIELEPPDHTRIRKLLQKAFMTRQIERLRPSIETLAHDLIDKMEGKTQVNLLPEFASPIPVTVIAELIGVPTTMNDQMLDWSQKMTKMYQLVRSPEDERAAVAATENFTAYLRDFVTYRRKKPADDLISHLIAVEEQGDKLTEDELISTCILLLDNGYEATVNSISNGAYVLLNHRDQLERLKADVTLTKLAVEELLRYDTPAHLFKRWALEDVTYKGYHFPFGTQIALVLGAANRDPAVFEQPDKLDIGRKRNPHVAFGAGIHFCIGGSLARLELEVALPILFKRLPDIELADQTPFLNTYPFRCLESLWVNI